MVSSTHLSTKPCTFSRLRASRYCPSVSRIAMQIEHWFTRHQIRSNHLPSSLPNPRWTCSTWKTSTRRSTLASFRTLLGHTSLKYSLTYACVRHETPDKKHPNRLTKSRSLSMSTCQALFLIGSTPWQQETRTKDVSTSRNSLSFCSKFSAHPSKLRCVWPSKCKWWNLTVRDGVWLDTRPELNLIWCLIVLIFLPFIRYDFDRNEEISADDVFILLSYIPFKKH